MGFCFIMYCKVSRHSLAAVLLFVGIGAFCQVTRSPFTALGLGDLTDHSLAHNQGNGGMGISHGTFWNLNNINPALLPYNSFTVFSAGFIGQNTSVSDGQTDETHRGGNLNYLVTSLPAIRGKWTTSLGLMPFSHVNYDFTYETTVTGSMDTVDIKETGTGGINRFFWSNGWAFNKNISAGVRATYLFSAVEKEFSSTLRDIGNAYTPVIVDRVSVSDFTFSAGLAYHVDSVFNSAIKLNAGIIYEFGSEVKAKRFQSFDRTVAGNPPIDADTLINNASGTLTIPRAIGIGLSLSKGTHWMVGAEARFQRWSDYRAFDGTNRAYDDAFKVTLGAEFTPDPASVTSYFKRITFRIGGSYETTPYLVETDEGAAQVNDIGINFGWSLPVGRYSNLDMAFRLGQRGDASKTIVEENYYKLYLGITLNDQWFIKRKYN